MPKRWTPLELVKAQQLYAEGLTYSQVATYFPDRTGVAVQHALNPRRQHRKWQGGPVEDPPRVRDPLLPRLAAVINRYANDNHIDLTEALNRLLCGGEAR